MKKEAIQSVDGDIQTAIRQLKSELGINAKPGRPVIPTANDNNNYQSEPVATPNRDVPLIQPANVKRN